MGMPQLLKPVIYKENCHLARARYILAALDNLNSIEFGIERGIWQKDFNIISTENICPQF